MALDPFDNDAAFPLLGEEVLAMLLLHQYLALLDAPSPIER